MFFQIIINLLKKKSIINQENTETAPSFSENKYKNDLFKGESFLCSDNSISFFDNQEKKQKLEEEKKLNDKIYQEKVDKEHEKNKDLIINTNNHDEVNYDEFKKEMDMFNGINSSNKASNIENNSESNIENNSESNSGQNIVEQQSQSTDINNLMIKLDTDLSKLKT